jgi:hypothetical protein
MDQAIRAAGLASDAMDVPIPEQYFLDAVASFWSGDFRLTFLSAAIALEAIALEWLDEQYQRRLAGGPGPQLRVIDIPRSGGRTTQGDPVYEVLESRTKFRGLLHERPLYVTGRSLLVEQEALYQRAQRLYATRNQIAHRGEIPDAESQCFTLTRPDAVTALQTVSAIFQWFGRSAPPDYPRDLAPARIAEWGSRGIEP